jgi:rRNA-processing protein FCF1
MLVTPTPGGNLDNLVKNLRQIHSEAFNLRAGSGPQTAHKRLLAYLEWASRSARMLRNQVSEADIAALVLNERYKLLLSSSGTMASPEMEVQRVVNDLVSLELDQRVTDLDDAITTLESERRRWTGISDLVLPDSNFYIHHPDKLEAADIASAAHLGGTTAHLLVPMVIVDELDGLKRQSKQPARWRAGYTVAVLDRVFKDNVKGNNVGTLRPDKVTVTGQGQVTGLGEVTMELLLDPLGHVRLPINDDEIVDRAVAVQTIAGRNVTLLTYDTGMSTRARSAGLRVVKLSEDIGEEPK